MLVATKKVRERQNYDRHESFRSIKYLNSILRPLGLSCIYIEGSELKYSWPLTKHVLLLISFTILNFFNLHRKHEMSAGHFTFTFKDCIKIIFLFGYVQYIVDIIYVQKYGRAICLEYYDIYYHIDKILPANYFVDIKNKVNRIIVVFTTVGVISSVCDVAAWYISCDSMFVGVNMIDYIYVIIRQLTVADHIAQIIQIEHRLKGFQKILHEYYVSCESLPGVVKDIIAEQGKLKTRNKITIKSIQTFGQNETIVSKLGYCYLLILEQTDYINAMYGIRVMGVCLTTLIDIIILMNVTIRILVETIKIKYYSGALVVVSTLFRIFSCALVLLCGMHRCENTYKQSENIIRLIYYILNNKRTTPEMKEKLNNLRDLMYARPVEFHAVKFYKLDYTLLLSVASVVVTYTIIFLQNLK